MPAIQKSTSACSPTGSPHFGTSCSLTPNLCPGGTASETGPIRLLITCNLRDEAKGEQMEINGTIYQRSFSSYRRIGKKLSSKIRRPVPDFGYESMGSSTYCAKKKTFSDKKRFRASSSKGSNIGRSTARSCNGLLLYALIVLNMVFNIFAKGLNRML